MNIIMVLTTSQLFDSYNLRVSIDLDNKEFVRMKLIRVAKLQGHTHWLYRDSKNNRFLVCFNMLSDTYDGWRCDLKQNKRHIGSCVPYNYRK